MPRILDLNEEDVNSFENCRNYTVSVIEDGNCGVGVGHICLFAEAGFKVIGVNANPHALKNFGKRRTPRTRAPLKAEVIGMLEKYEKEGVFTLSSDAREASRSSDIIVIAVETTVDNKNKADYSILEKTCKEVGMGLRRGSLVFFVSSTGPGVVEGSIRDVLERASGLQAGLDFGLALSPVKTCSHKCLSGFSNSWKIVGAIDDSSLKAASIIINRIAKTNVTKVSNIRTAEAINLFQNLNDEINLAQANELAFLSEKLRIDFLEVLKAAEKTKSFHFPLPGIADCLSRRRVRLLLEESENLNVNLRLALSATKINDEMMDYTFRLIKDGIKACGKTVRRAKVSVLGVSKRPDVKGPPGNFTRKIIDFLKRKVRTVQIYDPFFTKKELAELGFEAENLSKVAEGSDCIVVLVGHSRFKRLNLKKIKFLARKSPAIVDMGNVINPAKAEKHGFVYRGLGRGIWTR